MPTEQKTPYAELEVMGLPNNGSIDLLEFGNSDMQRSKSRTDWDCRDGRY